MHSLPVVFRALGDSTRLLILATIFARGEVCVCEFEQVLGITQSKASRHLRYLRNAGLLADRRKDQWMYYRIDPDADAARSAVLETVRSLVPPTLMTALASRLSACRAGEPCCGPVPDLAALAPTREPAKPTGKRSATTTKGSRSTSKRRGGTTETSSITTTISRRSVS